MAQEEMCCRRQARKLQEMFQKVQQENETLRNGRRPGTQAPLAGSGPQFNSLLSPPHNMRHQSNTPGSGRVVCPSSVHIHFVKAAVVVLLCCAVLCCTVLYCAVLQGATVQDELAWGLPHTCNKLDAFQVLHGLPESEGHLCSRVR